MKEPRSINELIKAAKDMEFEREQQKIDSERELKRSRTLYEASHLIDDWIGTYKNLKKSKVSISIAESYVIHLDRSFYTLRLFVNDTLIHIFNIEDFAGKNLTEGLEGKEYPGITFYTFYDNQK